MHLFIQLSIRVKLELQRYLTEHQELSEKQQAAIKRYIENEEILTLMANSYFDEWDANDRRERLEAWTRRAAAAITAVYQ